MNFVVAVFILTSVFMHAFSQLPSKAETVTLNGSNVYYEVYGKGKPLFLLHGYTWSSRFWHQFISDYADEYQIYLVDLRGHGRSEPFTGSVSVQAAARDVGALISYLKLKSIQVIAYSYGGEVVIQLALQNPGLINSMVIVGSCGSWSAKEFPEWVEMLSYKNVAELPWMREHQTSEERVKSILDSFPTYHIKVSDAEFKSIKTKTLFVVGDQDDSITFECLRKAKANLPNSFLWIIPNTGHRAHVDKNKPDFVRITRDFFSQEW